MAALFDYHYLTQEHIRGFDNYKYSSVDTSPVAVYISHPFWNQVAKLYPKWVAPNVLTFSGFVLVMASCALSAWLDWDLLASSESDVAPIPNFVWLLFAIANFAAHVLDGTDGKQARNTGASGPTGELFDHGIDSWLTVPFTVTLFSIFGCQDYSVSAYRQLLILMSVQLVFLVSHWEKYNTGILFLSWGYDVSQYMLSILYLATFFGGYKMWKYYVFGEISPAVIIESSFYFACFGMSIPMSLYNIHKAHKAGSLKQSSVWEAMRPLLSTLVLFSVTAVWAHTRDLAHLDFRSTSWLMGTIFSNIAMTDTRCEAWNWLLCPLVCLAVPSSLGQLSPGSELLALRVLAVLVTLAHLHYGISVVRQMCAHLGIQAFSLDYLKRKE